MASKKSNSLFFLLLFAFPIWGHGSFEVLHADSVLAEGMLDIQPYTYICSGLTLEKGDFPDDFAIYNPVRASFQFNQKGQYWAQLHLWFPEGHQEPLWVNFGPHYLVQCFRHNTLMGQSGHALPPHRQDHPAHTGWVQLPPSPGEEVVFLFKINTDRYQGTTPFRSTITTLPLLDHHGGSHFNRHRHQYIVGFLAFVIVCFMSLLALFQFFLINRDRTYLYYSGYLLCNGFYLYTILERISPYPLLTERYINDSLDQWVIPALMASYYCYIQFVRLMLDTENFDRGFDTLLSFFCNLTIVFFVGDIVLGHLVKASIYPGFRFFALLTVSVLAICVLIRAIKLPGYLKWYILIGSMFFSVGSILCFWMTEVLHTDPLLGVFHDGFTYFHIGIIMEMVFFFIALTFRAKAVELQKNEMVKGLAEEKYEKAVAEFKQQQSEAYEAKRTRFFADANHELRTPLTIIKAAAESIDDDPANKKIILNYTDNMMSTINDMLDLSKVEAGNMRLEWLQGDLILFLKDQLPAWESLAANKNIDLHFKTDLKRLLMDFDYKKLAQIISNLLVNAVKYTDQDDGTIIIQVSYASNLLNIHVIDNGIGMDQKTLEHIFDRYYREQNQQTVGTGIGLSLARQLAQLMGGNIDVESQPGKGSQFTVSLPVTNQAPLSVVANYAENDAKIMLKQEADIPTPTPLVGQWPPSPSNNKPTVLLVEDSLDIVHFLKNFLSHHFDILVAYDGQEGIDQARQHLPSLIVSDVRMPIKDGFELCHTLKNDSETSHIPIILLTAQAGETAQIAGYRQGADAYLTKPFNSHKLFAIIQNLIKLRQQLHQKFAGQIDKITNRHISNNDQKIINDLIQHLKTQLNPPPSVDDLCHTLGISRTALHKKIKSLTDLTTSELRKKIRMQEAARILQSNHSTSQTAYELGYASPSNFSKDFKKVHGVSPKFFLEGKV